jgi:hypothetical protein
VLNRAVLNRAVLNRAVIMHVLYALTSTDAVIMHDLYASFRRACHHARARRTDPA